jgi:CelD/BcsL family acetyltransferase involved in cellulose biosynthesis
MLFLIGEEAEPLGLAPMMREDSTISFLGSTDLFDYHDVILGRGEPGAFYHGLVACLKSETWQTLSLESVPGDSPTLQYLPDIFRQDGYAVSVEQEDVVPGLHLPPTWDDYLAGLRKKDRHELRRKMRRLDESAAARMVRSSGETLSDDIDLFLDMMRESREEKRDFLIPERETFFRATVQRMYDEGFLRLLFLEVDGERVAGVVCFDYAGRRFLYNSGFRSAYGNLSVGLMLKTFCLREAIEEGLEYFDFLRGPEAYKYHLGAKDADIYRVIVHR